MGDIALYLFTLVMSGSAVYTVARSTQRRLNQAAQERAVRTAEAMVADSYALYEDFYDTPTPAPVRPGRHP